MTVAEAVTLLYEMRGVTPHGQTFSAGVAAWEAGTEPTMALAQADRSLYQAKRAGRDRIFAQAVDERSLPTDLTEPRIVVQPIVDLLNGKVVAYEALSRFGTLAPLGVFHLAAEDGWADILEARAINAAIRMPNRPDVPLHVNASAAAVAAWRVPHEQRVLDAAAVRLRTAVVRPGVVYGGSRGIVGDLFKDGANGLIRVVGDGTNRWPLIYDRDLAELYLRILTTPSARGIFHANDEGDERVADIVQTIARHSKTGADIRNIPIEEARAKMGPYADALALDQVVRSARSRAIGWVPSLRSVSGNVPRLFEEWRRGHEG